MGGSRSGSSTTTVERLPSYIAGVNGYAHRYMAGALNLYYEVKAEKTVYGEPTFATSNADETGGILALTNRGRRGDPLVSAGIGCLMVVLAGSYRDGTHASFLALMSTQQDVVANTFTNSIRPLLGGSLHYVGDLSGANLAQSLTAGSVAKIMDRVFSAVYADNYNRERRNMVEALSLSLEMDGQVYKDAEVLRRSGMYTREYNQSFYTDAYKVWYEEEVRELRNLDIIGNSIRSMVGTQSSTTKPYYRPSPAVAVVGGMISGGITGGMLAGASAGGMTGPQGALLGAVAGGVMSLF